MLIFLTVLLALTHPDPGPPQKTTLVVDIQNVLKAEGRIEVGLFKPCDGFPSKCRPVEKRRMVANKGTIRTAFEVEPGEYALAAYHDLNSNGKIDTRLFGIPKEPYGFSNNVRPQMSAPTFAECRIVISAENKAIHIQLK